VAFGLSPQTNFVNVRTYGVVPILTDDTTNSTGINPGDYVATSTSTTTSISSQTVSMAGCIAKASRSSNALAAGQHIVGISYTLVTPAATASRFALVRLLVQEV